MKKYLYFIVFLFIVSSANSHVEHYKNLKRLEFDLYRNNKFIGTHIYDFSKENEVLTVKSKINFKIKKLGIVLYKYSAQGTELYKDENLVNFNSTTNQNGKKKYVNIELNGQNYIIDGSSYRGTAPRDYILGTWWNHAIVKANAQISAVSGRIIKQKVTFLGKETIKINGKKLKTLHFNFSSSDKKLDEGKRLNTDIWYDENELVWVKASFKKKGFWEYRLRLKK